MNQIKHHNNCIDKLFSANFNLHGIRFSLIEFFTNSEIPWGTNILLIGCPGVGKTMFCENLLCECLSNGTKTLYITTDRAPNDANNQIKKNGIDPTVEDRDLVFVDGYSWLVGEFTERYCVENLSNLSDLSVKISSASSTIGENAFVIFDSISTLLTYNSENDVERFLEVNMARMKHRNNIGLWVIEEGMHSEKLYNALRHMSDSTLEMRIKENDEKELTRLIRMHTFKGHGHSTRWFHFTVRPDGRLTFSEDIEITR